VRLTQFGFRKVIHLSPEEANTRYFAGRRDGLRAPHVVQLMSARHEPSQNYSRDRIYTLPTGVRANVHLFRGPWVKRMNPNAGKTILRFLAGPEAAAVVEAKGVDRIASK